MLEHVNRLVLPLIVSNIVHMIAIRMAWLPGLARPVHAPLFGANKTWRGFLLLPLLNALALPLFNPGDALLGSIGLGAFLGLVYMLFELPNSFVKRRMGIASGAQAASHRLLFGAMDKTDSALGVSLAYYALTDITAMEALWLFLICSTAHVLFSLLLVSLRIKRGF
jgi:hypothetical protein